jgi:hypothetical protein
MWWKYKRDSQKPLGKEWGAWRRRQYLNPKVRSLTNPQNSEMKFCENMKSALLKIIIITHRLHSK